MSSARLPLLTLLGLALLGCAGSYRVVQLPQREADLYPLSQTRADVTVAIDEIRSPERVERYFGANLLRERILPIAIIVSNNAQHQVSVKPSDILLHRGAEIVDPLPVETVVAMAKDQHWFLRARTEKDVERYFDGLAFKETTLPPGETYQGVMFFSIPQPERSEDTFFRILKLFRESGMKIRVGARDLDSRSRIHFGPFSLSPQERPFD